MKKRYSRAKTIYGWHILRPNRKLRYSDNRIVKTGETLTAKGPLSLCHNGMHASERLHDADRIWDGTFLTPGYVCRVRVDGVTQYDDGYQDGVPGAQIPKFVGRSRTVLGMVKYSTAVKLEFDERAILKMMRKNNRDAGRRIEVKG